MLIDTTPIRGPLSHLQPIEIQPVRSTPDEALFNSLMEQHHYLGYEQPVGEYLKYVFWAQGRPIRTPVAYRADLGASHAGDRKGKGIGMAGKKRPF